MGHTIIMPLKKPNKRKSVDVNRDVNVNNKGAGIFDVEAILARRPRPEPDAPRNRAQKTRDRGIKFDYLIKWFGYDFTVENNREQSTWEPEEHLNYFLIENFEKDLEFRMKNPGKRSRFNNYHEELTTHKKSKKSKKK